MEKTDPDAENVARTASDLTVAMAEEALGVTMVYRTYTAEGSIKVWRNSKPGRR